MKFKTLKAERLSDKVVHEIISMIEAGKLKPGDKLPTETDFAEQLGVSRGILREALTILQVQGYISRKPKDGTYIRELPEKNAIDEPIITMFKKASYRDLIEMRESLEQKVVELAIERARDEEILEIERMLSNISLADEKIGLADQNFHLRLAELSRNILLINFISLYYDLIHEIAENNFKSVKRQEEVIKEHIEIIQAIKERNVTRAKHSVVYHLRMVKKFIDTNEIDQHIQTD
ncbi:FadR/GntR family transcriptional regulator [Brassicibacter mesophilus]|uniref:FadR/GntR family transcriptional regulator n=1 Tax=Brassicibacter mesophilus TaxID=745119 RepID=UPI003D1CB92B